MPTFLRGILTPILCPLALAAYFHTTLGATPQQPATDGLISLDRIRKELATTPTGLKLDMPLQVPMATFKTQVDQRRYVISFEDWIEKEFTLTPLQRQSAEWAAKCCGVSLDPLFKSLENALQRRRLRKIREQIARELAELDAARKKMDVGASPPR